MKTVGIISDTHGKLNPKAYEGLVDCDAIIHAGDIGDPAVLRELKTIGPVYAVLGNNDFDEYGKLVNQFARPVIEGVSFLVSHYPQAVRQSPEAEEVYDVCIHGHTHDPYIAIGEEAAPAVLRMCPGSTYRARGFTQRGYGKITVDDGKVINATLYNLEGEVVGSVSLDEGKLS